MGRHLGRSPTAPAHGCGILTFGENETLVLVRMTVPPRRVVTGRCRISTSRGV